MNIYEKLGIIQSKLKAPKGQYNSFGKYKYRSCEDILEAVKPLLAETKTVLSVTDRMEVVGDRIYVRAEAHLNDCEDTGEITMSIKNIIDKYPEAKLLEQIKTRFKVNDIKSLTKEKGHK